MSRGKRVTLGTLGLWLAGGALLTVASVSCAPEHNPDYPGAPFVTEVFGVSPDDPGMTAPMYMTDRADVCGDLDFEGGTGQFGAEVPTTFGFRVVFSELLDGDKVEQLDETGVGTELFPGIVTVTDRQGNPVTSTLDPSITLGPDALLGIYQPAGGNGCFGTVYGVDLTLGGTPAPGPAFILALNAVPALPASTELTLHIDGLVPGSEIVDHGGAGLEGGSLAVDFVTSAMTVDCPSIDACNVAPVPDPAEDAILGDIGFVQVGFNTWVGDPSGVFLYDDTMTLVPGITAIVDSTYADAELLSDFVVDLIAGTEAAPEPLTLTEGVIYTIVVTDQVTDLWGVPAQPIPDDTSCADLGVTLTNCIWAGQFTGPPPA